MRRKTYERLASVFLVLTYGLGAALFVLALLDFLTR
jgi:hypothetical protein